MPPLLLSEWRATRPRKYLKDHISINVDLSGFLLRGSLLMFAFRIKCTEWTDGDQDVLHFLALL